MVIHVYFFVIHTLIILRKYPNSETKISRLYICIYVPTRESIPRLQHRIRIRIDYHCATEAIIYLQDRM